MTLPTLLAFAWHQPGLQWMCIAALYVTVLARRGTWQERLVEALPVVTLGLSLLTLGTAVAASRWAELLVTPLVIGACAYAWVWGPRTGLHGRMCAILFAVGLGIPPHTGSEIVHRSWWFTVGGVWGIAVTLVASRFWRPGVALTAWTRPVITGWQQQARQELGWHSENFHHALRAGLLAAGATVLARWLELDRHYWVTITVVSVLVPSRDDSWVRGVQVALATLLAAGIVAVAGALVPNDYWLLALVFVAAAAAGTASGVNFGLYLVGALTAMLLQLELLTRDLHVWKVRIADAGLGVALTLATWGLYELPRLRHFLRRPAPVVPGTTPPSGTGGPM